MQYAAIMAYIMIAQNYDSQSIEFTIKSSLLVNYK
jgi:hypothetical protein